MKVLPTTLDGVVVIEPRIHRDARGHFFETWSEARYSAAGIPGPFVQDNASLSVVGTLRGLHLQHPVAQGKLVYVLQGAVLDVAVDVRVGSPTFGQHVAIQLDETDHRQLYIPPGFAHGFFVTSDSALFAYKCTGPYDSASEITIAWSDPTIAIAWPSTTPLLSPRDAEAPPLSAVLQRLPRF